MDPLDTSQPFTRAAALAAGITDRQLRGSAYTTIFTGVYVAATTVTPELRLRAALACHPEAYASHASAARWHGFPIPTLPAEHLTMRVRRHRRSRPGIVCHLAQTGAVVTLRGVRVTSPLQTFVDLATILDLVDLVVVGDHLVRQPGLGPEALRRFCADSTSPGVRRARAAAAYVCPRTDSPMETRLRMLVVLAGLPAPEVNWSVRDEIGDPIRRYDLCWRASRTALEYDGRQHAENPQQWESDIERRGASEDEGWRLITVIASGIYRWPEATLTRIHRALLDRGESGVPATLSDAWRPHFPGY